MTLTRRNSESKKSIKLEEIVRLVEGELVGDRSVTITGVAGIKEAQKGDITFLANAKYLPFLEETQASAIITSKEVHSSGKTLVRTVNPSLAFTRVLSIFSDSKPERPEGVHPSAVLHKTARLGGRVSIGPHVVIEKDVVIGDNTVIEAGVFIGEACALGADVWIYPNVTIREATQIHDRVMIHSGTVIGSDGFGYETVDGSRIKIPHTGWVLIEEDVEIGANVCVDRGRFSKTWIQKGAKIDNLVQIAHNVVIGPNCLVVSQCGISGSSELGKNVVLAGQVGLVGHITLGDNTIVGARSGVSKSFPMGSVLLGEPARPIAEQKKILAVIAKLPELFKDILELKKKAR